MAPQLAQVLYRTNRQPNQGREPRLTTLHPTKPMRYIAFATDYDGTLATDGHVNTSTLQSLQRLKASGRKLFLVSGRFLRDFDHIFPEITLFDRVVAENGAILYDPRTREETLLAEAPEQSFLTALRTDGIPFDVGQAIIASRIPHEGPILNVIQRLGLDYQVGFNKGAVMVLPSGVNKATGLEAALDDLKLSFRNAVAIGDAENDHAFLSASECSIAVANALRAIRERVDIVTEHDEGDGVIEAIESLLKDDLQSYDSSLKRSSIPVGLPKESDGEEVRIVPNRSNLLAVGASASGKSSAIAGILEQIAERGYQFCLIDPEGDFDRFPGILPIGSPTERPDASVVTKALETSRSVVVNLMGVSLRDRPATFATLLPSILAMRSKTAQPHWLVIDEAHHLLPANWSPTSSTEPHEIGGTIFITVHPDRLSSAALGFIDTVMATGDLAWEALSAFAKSAQANLPQEEAGAPKAGEALVWIPRGKLPPFLITTKPAKSERRRHLRNYAQGELSAEQSFYFRGRDAKLNLRAQNLMTFVQLSEGVDDDTWLFHLRRGDVSRWLSDIIKDPNLAATAAAIEENARLSPADSRARLKAAIEQRYTAPP
jgi:hydroxymethylpyrimidine pyrophosphatase-like HAD family hydrolase